MINSERILDGVKVGLIDADLDLDSELKPKFVYNNIDEGISVVSTIKKELNESIYFWFSVAFITKGGIQYLKNRLNELEEKGVKGRILTTNFLGFNEPDSFLELLKFENLEIRVSEENMHTKGYMFHKNDGIKVALLGSSNLIMNALKKNVEWNIKINSLENGELVTDIEDEFNKIWERSQVLTSEWIDNYKDTFVSRESVLRKEKVVDIESYKLVPNKMQVAALKELSLLRDSGENRGLLISSTGTGKTYLSAFDVRAYNPRKVLFIAHREQILKQAKESYSKVLPRSKKSTILSGNTKDKASVIDYDMVFATIQTISKDSILSKIISGEISLNEHMGLKWLKKEELKEIDWIEADIEIVEKLWSSHSN